MSKGKVRKWMVHVAVLGLGLSVGWWVGFFMAWALWLRLLSVLLLVSMGAIAG